MTATNMCYNFVGFRYSPPLTTTSIDDPGVVPSTSGLAYVYTRTSIDDPGVVPSTTGPAYVYTRTSIDDPGVVPSTADKPMYILEHP